MVEVMDGVKVAPKSDAEIIAWQWSNDADSDEVPGWLDPFFTPFEEYATIQLGEGQADIVPGDWVILDRASETLIPCGAAAFESLFLVVE
jgi:hypothetical protein